MRDQGGDCEGAVSTAAQSILATGADVRCLLKLRRQREKGQRPMATSEQASKQMQMQMQTKTQTRSHASQSTPISYLCRRPSFRPGTPSVSCGVPVVVSYRLLCLSCLLFASVAVGLYRTGEGTRPCKAVLQKQTLAVVRRLAYRLCVRCVRCVRSLRLTFERSLSLPLSFSHSLSLRGVSPALPLFRCFAVSLSCLRPGGGCGGRRGGGAEWWKRAGARRRRRSDLARRAARPEVAGGGRAWALLGVGLGGSPHLHRNPTRVHAQGRTGTAFPLRPRRKRRRTGTVSSGAAVDPVLRASLG